MARRTFASEAGGAATQQAAAAGLRPRRKRKLWPLIFPTLGIPTIALCFYAPDEKTKEMLQIPEVKPPVAHSVVEKDAAAATTTTMPDIEGVALYQYEVCPFCCKVKAFLDLYGIPYRTVEVDPLRKTEIKWSSDYKKVPIVTIDGKQQLNDSSAIIDELAERYATPKCMSPRTKGMFGKPQSFFDEEQKWRSWVDKWLVHVITINIYRTLGESYQAFEYITTSGNFPFHTREIARHTGAIFMYGLSGRIKKKHSIDAEPREALYACGKEWKDALDGQAFHGGDAGPDLADASVFGVLRAIRDMDAHGDLMNAVPEVKAWFDRMDALCVPRRVN
ncbi:prostaglandin-E synthase 2 [Pseudoscourfieldia marina]